MPLDLTLAMIVRDGAATLARCLESVQGIADRIVVVDTGSKDDSVDIAKRHGANVVEIPWPDAFDEARNRSLDEVKTEWALVLDADEWLDPQSAAQVRESLQDSEAAGYYLLRRDLASDGAFTEQAMLRLWRHREGVRFRGVIHEQIYEDELRRETGLEKVGLCEARILHDGYVEDAPKEKDLKEIRMIQKELALRPDQIYFECLLASLQVKHEIPEGSTRLRHIVQRCLDAENEPNPPHPEVALPLAIHLTKVPAMELDSSRTARVVRLCWKWFGYSPLVVYGISELEKRRNNLAERHRALCRLAEMATTGNYSRQRSFDPALFGPWLWRNLIESSRAVRAPELEAEAARNLLRFEPDNALAKSVLGNV